MRILVTGAAGFLGTNLCLRLIKEGHKVIGVDNFQTGRLDNITMLKEASKKDPIAFFNVDITQAFDYNREYNGKLDWIFHLACPASPPHYQKDMRNTVLVNVLGTDNAIQMAKAHNARILLASTSEVYGDPLEHPQKETYWGRRNPFGPRSCYDEGKAAAEALMFAAINQAGVKGRIARIFNTYGPFMDANDGRVVSNFIVKSLKNDSLEVYGDGSQTRSICFVDDMIDGLIKLMESDVQEPVNLGNPDEKTVLELARIILKLTRSSSAIIHKPLPIDDPKQRCPDISKAKKLLNWQSKVSIEEGIKKTIPYFRKVLELSAGNV
ncbi:GDP-mannose 4,6-dehydratase [Candidatus Woesearchaeota archaeon]|nr:GDP-mannose 4,6-dehydratase [Candidatus Woesearchaeota archaeon]